MTHFVCYDYNTLSGALSLPSGMTYFECGGYNTLSGALSLPSGMTYFVCSGSNTLSGALSLPSVMTHFECGGYNTLSGALSLPSGMTYFVCGGSNTLSGTLLPVTTLTYFYITGCNTVIYPTSSGTNTWGTTINTVFIRPYTAGIWTSEMTDALFIDLAATVTTASGSKALNIAGNCAAPTSASLTARTYLSGLGFVITVTV